MSRRSGSGRDVRGRLWQADWPDHAVLRAEVPVTVPFQDADPTGFTWHGNYFRYFDSARVALLGKLDLGYFQMGAAGQIWPIIDTRVRYVKSAPFNARLKVSAQLVEWEFRLRIYYQIHNEANVLINEAFTVQVPVEAQTETMIVGIPAAIQARVQQLIQTGSR
jgi:acyl-CoA thioester hydrolase